MELAGIYKIFLDPVAINTLGLFFDIFGAGLLFKFGLPENISRSGAINLIAEQTDEEEKKKATRYDMWGKIGLSALMFGFVLQAISNFL